MVDAELETRVKNLEHEMARLKLRIAQDKASGMAWWDKIAGTFKDDKAHEEAMSLGREYRLAQKSNKSTVDGE